MTTGSKGPLPRQRRKSNLFNSLKGEVVCECTTHTLCVSGGAASGKCLAIDAINEHIESIMLATGFAGADIARARNDVVGVCCESVSFR